MIRGAIKFLQDIAIFGKASLMFVGVFLKEEYKASKYSNTELASNLPPDTVIRKMKNGYRVTLHVEDWNRPISFTMNNKQELQVRAIALYRTINEFKVN